MEALTPTVGSVNDIPLGTVPIFSPRRGLAALDLYVNLVDRASSAACITLAFGINQNFKSALQKHTKDSAITFLLLEKRDRPTKANQDTFVALNAQHNVYSAWGAYIRDPVYQWARETNARGLGLNRHVSYIHSKFLLANPLGNDPVVVTGSANFSAASTNANDENMLIVRGDQRVADIYFTEFNRLFNHYFFRSVMEAVREREAGRPPTAGLSTPFLKERAQDWLPAYEPGRLKRKRLDHLTKMSGF